MVKHLHLPELPYAESPVFPLSGTTGRKAPRCAGGKNLCQMGCGAACHGLRACRIAGDAAEETINELVNTVEAIRRIGAKTTPVNCIRGLFKALICLIDQNNDKAALRIYQLLKKEISERQRLLLHAF